MKAFFTHPATIIIGSILILIGIGWIGKTYWGWFGGKSDKGYPNFQNMTKPQLIDWLVKNAGLDKAQLEGKTQQELAGIANSAYGNAGYGNQNSGTGGRYDGSQEIYMIEEDNSTERIATNGLKCFPVNGYFKDKAGNDMPCPLGITYPDGSTWVKVSEDKVQCCYKRKGGATHIGQSVSDDLYSDIILYDANGQAINPKPGAKARCDKECLVAVPAGSQYAGYYYCKSGKVPGGYCA